MENMSRRGLLSLMAAAPIATLAKPAPLYASGGFIGADAMSIARVGERCGESLVPMTVKVDFDKSEIRQFLKHLEAAQSNLSVVRPTASDGRSDAAGAGPPVVAVSDHPILQHARAE